MAHIIITGNPVDGVAHYGPFVTADEASEWAMDEFPNGDWWVATLYAVEGCSVPPQPDLPCHWCGRDDVVGEVTDAYGDRYPWCSRHEAEVRSMIEEPQPHE